VIAPAVLLPYQQAWIADHAQVKICEKSRRIGLSWAEAADDALTAAAAAGAGGDDGWYIGYNREMAEEFIRDVAFWSRHYALAASEIGEEVFRDEDRDILTYVIRFASGFRVTALSSRPSNLRGKQGIVVIDEAAFHDDLDGLIKAAMALLMWGGKVRIISTHDGELNDFNELILDVRAGKKPYSVHRIEFRQAVAQGLYKRICMSTGKQWSQAAEEEWVAQMYAFYGDHAAEELDVIPSSGSGAYLTRAMIEAVMQPDIPVIRYEQTDAFALLPARIREAEVRDWCDAQLAPVIAAMPQNFDTYLGGDFARSGDLSVYWPLMQTRELVLTTPFTVELRNVPFEQQRQIAFYIGDRLPRFRAGAFDARGNGQYLAEVMMQRYGAGRIEPVMLSTEWYRNNMPRVKAAIEDKTFVMPRDADTLADYRSLKVDKGVAKVPENARTRGSDGRNRHGDSAIAGALAIYAATTMEPAPIEFQSLGRPRAGHLIDSAFAGGRMAPIRDAGFGVVGGGNDFRGFG
jgi:phage FluMu gp28-like protein